MSAQAQQQSILYGEILSILAEQRVLNEKQARLQQRLEELVVTLDLKAQAEFEVVPPAAAAAAAASVAASGQRGVPSSTPTKSAVSFSGVGKKNTSSASTIAPEDDDDLGPAPIDGYSEDANTLETESGWEHATPHSRGKSPLGDSSLSLSYSFSPVATNNTRTDISEGLSPAPLHTSSSSSSVPVAAGGSTTPVAHPGLLGGSDLISGAATVIGAATARLFGSPLRSGSDSSLNKQQQQQPPQSQKKPAAEDRGSNGGYDKSQSVAAAAAAAAAPEPAPQSEPAPAPASARAPAVSAEEKAAREAQAATMSMSALSQALGAWLVQGGAPNKSRGLKETVDECCQELGVAVTGNLKKDAVACFALIGDSSASAVVPLAPSATVAAGSGSPVPSSHSAATTTANPSTPQAAPVSAAALSIFSPTSTSSFTSRLRAYYKTHNPEKIGEVDTIAARFAGREGALIAKLEKLYGATFPLA